ncbi:hypothetical protein [Croceiramulus getboli]|nr:hypothetical protein P8624_12065 [Flavobacteriaceae bacterium YJPT1-3]
MKTYPVVFAFAFLFAYSCQKKASSSEPEIELLTLKDSILFRQSPDPDRPSPTVIQVYEKLNFGNGYNSTTGQEYFGVIDYQGAEESTEVSAGARGNTGQITIEMTESQEDLKNSLNISAEAALDFQLGAWSSKNKLKLSTLQETEFNDFSQHVIIKASYVNEPQVLIEPKVRDDLIRLAQRDPETFMRSCGDMFVSRIYTGGELYTLFSLHSRDSREQEKNNLFFSTANKYLGTTINAQVDVTTMNDAVNKTKNLNTTVITEGGGPTPKTLDLPSYLEYASTFKEDVSNDNRAVILYVELSPYESISGFPDIDFSKIRVVQKGMIENLSAILSMLEEDESNYEFVKANTDLFSEEDIEAGEEAHERYLNYRAVAQKMLADCRADPDACNVDELVVFNEFTPYKPHIDLPEWAGDATELPLTMDSGWVTVFDDTEATGKLLSLAGSMQIRRSINSNPRCREAVYKRDRVVYRHVKTKRTGPFWNRRQHYATLYKQFIYPYYEVSYRSKKTGQELRRFIYTTPILTESNVEVRMRLRNPLPVLQVFENGRYFTLPDWLYEYVDFDPEVEFPIIESCNQAEPLSAVVSDPGSKPKIRETAQNGALTGSASVPRKQPEGSFKEGVYTIDYDDNQ